LEELGATTSAEEVMLSFLVVLLCCGCGVGVVRLLLDAGGDGGGVEPMQEARI
jgi:hypothetical protein